MNFIDIVNETFILITGYYMILFSDWTYNPVLGNLEEYQYDPMIKYNSGYGYIVLLLMIFSFNLSFIIQEFCKAAIKANRKRIYYNKWGTYYKIKIFNHVMR